MNFDEWSELCFRLFSPINTEIPSPTAPPAGLPEASRETYVPTDAESSFRLGIFINVFGQNNAELKFHLHQKLMKKLWFGMNFEQRDFDLRLAPAAIELQL